MVFKTGCQQDLQEFHSQGQPHSGLTLLPLTFCPLPISLAICLSLLLETPTVEADSLMSYNVYFYSAQ